MDESFDMNLEEGPNRIRTITELGYWHTGAFTYNGGVYLNRVQTIPVPAGVNLRLQLHPLQNLKNEWVPVTIPQTINLKQGEVTDFGRWEEILERRKKLKAKTMLERKRINCKITDLIRRKLCFIRI